MTKIGSNLRAGTLAGLLLSSALLSGCAGVGILFSATAIFSSQFEYPDLSPDEAQRLLGVKSISPPTESPYVSKGEVKGVACRTGNYFKTNWKPTLSKANGETPEDAALMQLKLNAVRAGGNAILAPTCVHKDSFDWSYNCFETWVCTGEAVRLTEK